MTAGAPSLRRSVLDLPAHGLGRYGVLLLTLFAAGLFAATSGYLALFGTPWEADLVRCRTAVGCRVPEPLLAVLPFLTAAVLVAGAVAALVVAPAVTRARRRVDDVAARFPGSAVRVVTLAREMGLRTAPTVVGASGLRDAFCFGRPGRTWIALPTALLIRPGTPVFEVVVRHELAHVRQRDVALAGMARSAWWALAPLLALPVPLAFAGGHSTFVPAYLWRAGIFAVVVLLIQRELLRTREYEADLQAARSMGGIEPVLGVLPAAGSAGIRQVLSWHPDGQARRVALREPERIARIGVGEAVGAGFLTALTLSLFADLLRSLLTPIGVSLPAGLVVGPLVGATLAVGLLRQAVAGRRSGRIFDVRIAVVGVFLGALAGQAISFVEVGLAGVGQYGDPVFLLVVAGAAAGVTAVVGGLAALAADRQPATSRLIAPWIIVPAAGALLFAAALATGQQLADALSERGGWPMVDTIILKVFASAPVAVLALALAAVAAGLLAWPGAVRKSPSLAGAVGFGALVGVPAALVLAAVDLTTVAADPTDLVRRVDLVWWAAGAAGAVTALVLRLRYGPRGAGVALLSSMIAALLAAAGYLLIEGAVRHTLSGSGLWTFLVPALALGLLLPIAVGWLLVPRLVGTRAAWFAAVTAGAVVTAAVFGLGSVIVPRSIFNADPNGDLASYSHDIALPLRQRFATIFASMYDISQATPALQRARLDSEVAAPLDQLIHDEQQYRTSDPQAADLHAQGIAALVDIRQNVGKWQAALRDNSQAEYDAVNVPLVGAIHRFESWSVQFGA